MQSDPKLNDKERSTRTNLTLTIPTIHSLFQHDETNEETDNERTQGT